MGYGSRYFLTDVPEGEELLQAAARGPAPRFTLETVRDQPHRTTAVRAFARLVEPACLASTNQCAMYAPHACLLCCAQNLVLCLHLLLQPKPILLYMCAYAS